MTSNTDQNEFLGNANETQDHANQVRSRSADLEKILNSLGHAVSDSQKRNEEALKGLGARARELGASVVTAQENAPHNKADIFDALEDQMSDLAQKTNQVRDCEEDDQALFSDAETPETPDENIDVVAQAARSVEVAEEDDIGAAEWDQMAADELAQIYSEMDAEETSEELAEFDADQTSEELAEENAMAAERSHDEHMEAAQEVEPELSGELDDKASSDEMMLEARFAGIASRIEDVLSADDRIPVLKSIETRFDNLEEKFNSLMDTPEDDGAISALETQMHDLNEQFGHVVSEISRIATIEENVNRLIDDFSDSRGNLETVLAGIARSKSSDNDLDREQVEQKSRLIELHDALDRYIHESRSSDQQTIGAITSLQSGIDDIVDYLIANDHALAADEEPGQAPYQDQGVDGSGSGEGYDEPAQHRTGEFEDDEFDLSAQIKESPEVMVTGSHGAAQHAFAVRVEADLRAETEIEPVHLSDQLQQSELDETFEAGVSAEDYNDAPDQDLSRTKQETISDDAVDTEVARLSTSVHAEGDDRNPNDVMPAHLVAQRDQMIIAAREAAQSAKTAVQDGLAVGEEAVKAENFLATARMAARAAAARAAAAEQDELLKATRKKKRSLFSFGRGGPSPVLVVATTLLTLTTAGLVYSQIKDHSDEARTAHNAAPLVRADKESLPANMSAFSGTRRAEIADNGTAHASAHVQKTSQVAGTVSGEGNPVLINEVPHHRSDKTDGIDVPVGIVVEMPDNKPDLKQLARFKRGQKLAKMSSDLTGDLPQFPVTNVAIKPDDGLAAPKAASRQNNAPTLARPPAAIGPFSLREAASRGDAGSQFEVGSRYAQGRGIKRNYTDAVKWYSRAAAQGHAIAQYRLAALYEKGLGVGKKDGGRARIWYRRSAEKGNIKAMHNLAVLYTGRNNSRPDYSTAAHWFKSAAERGLADSQFNLGILYANGLGVKRNKVEAFKWFSLAAQRGDGEAAKRRDALKSAMSAGQLKSAQSLAKKWQGKPVTQGANIPHKAAVLLKKSEVNSDVNKRKLLAGAQSMLGKLGYKVGAADGKMGPRTRDAILNFQKRSGLKVTGDVTPELISRLSGLVG